MKYLLSLLSLLFAEKSLAQTDSLLKTVIKRNIVDVSIIGRIPVWNNANADTKNGFSPGISLGFARRTGSRIAVGGEISVTYNSFDAAKYLHYYPTDDALRNYNGQVYYFSTSALVKVELMQLKTAKLELSHILAWGPTFNHCQEKDYAYTQQPAPGNSPAPNSLPGTFSIPTFQEREIDFTTMYALNIRCVLTTSLRLNAGIRVTFNRPVSGSLFVSSKSIDPSSYDARSVTTAIEQSQLRNVLSARVGLSYAF